MPQIYLIAPQDPDVTSFPALLESVLASGEVSALLLRRGSKAENAYKALAKAVVPVTQAHGCALLLEGEPGQVRLLNADGLHLAAEPKLVREAIGTLKPQMIVGAGPVSSRHEAMVIGELEIDYVMFGSLDGAVSPEQREMARWWAETMEVPAVLCDPESSVGNIDTAGCEFIALGANVWNAPEGPAAAVAACARWLETSDA